MVNLHIKFTSLKDRKAVSKCKQEAQLSTTCYLSIGLSKQLCKGHESVMNEPVSDPAGNLHSSHPHVPATAALPVTWWHPHKLEQYFHSKPLINLTVNFTTIFYGHYTGQLALASTPIKNWRILLEQSFTARTSLLTATSAFGLW